eukprot:5201268-Pyramimonas_sp.AAC.1
MQIRSSTVSADQLKSPVKQHIGLIERCQLKGGTDEFMKNNIPLLLGLAEHTTRVRWKSSQSAVLQQKPNMRADECRRFCQGVTNSFSHTCNNFHQARTGSKLDAHA